MASAAAFLASTETTAPGQAAETRVLIQRVRVIKIRQHTVAQYRVERLFTENLASPFAGAFDHAHPPSHALLFRREAPAGLPEHRPGRVEYRYLVAFPGERYRLMPRFTTDIDDLSR